MLFSLRRRVGAMLWGRGRGGNPTLVPTFQGDGGKEASARSRHLRLLDVTPLLPPSFIRAGHQKEGTKAALHYGGGGGAGVSREAGLMHQPHWIIGSTHNSEEEPPPAAAK